MNVVLPIVTYDWLRPVYGDVVALMASSLPPLSWSTIGFMQRRRVDAMSSLVLAGIALSLLAFVGGGGLRLLQLREKLVTALIGLAFLASAALGRPLVYHLARAGEARTSPEALAVFEARQNTPLFRRTMMTMTLGWGFGLVAEAALASLLVFILPVRDYLIVSPCLSCGTMGALGFWTLWLRRRRSAQLSKTD